MRTQKEIFALILDFAKRTHSIRAVTLEAVFIKIYIL